MALTSAATLFFLSLFACPRSRCCTVSADNFGTTASAHSGSGSSSLEPFATSLPSHCYGTVVNYFSAFPCMAGDFDEVRGDEGESDAGGAMRILRTCDLFTFVASELAVRHVNEHRQGIFTYPNLPDSTLNQFAVTETESDVAHTTFQFERRLQNIDDQPIHGVIGPQASEVAIYSLANIATRYNITQITYGATSPQLSDKRQFPYLHHTTPTTALVNLGRLQLLGQFNWQRCALFSSTGFLYTESANELMNMANKRTGSEYTIDLRYYGTFDETARSVLGKAVQDEMRIFIVISDKTGTRNTLCEAHRYKQVKLTGPAYVWILPSFYDPRWWELSEDEIDRLHPSQQCSNYEMEEILNTTHVFSIGVYNYQYESLDSGWPQSVNITHQSFLEMLLNLTLHYLPSLSNTNLHPFLLHSQAASAYDAVWALSSAWHTAIPTLLYARNSCSIIAFNERDNIAGGVLNRTLNGTFECAFESEMNYDPSYFQGVSGRHDFSKDANSFGKVLVSQYIDATERPVGIYTSSPVDSGTPRGLGEMIYLFNSTEDWLFEAPQDFLWLAGSVPSDGVRMKFSEIPTAAVMVVLTAIFLSFAFATGIGIASLVLRNNNAADDAWNWQKRVLRIGHIKASSPGLSSLILVGLVLIMPRPLQTALVNSGHTDNSPSPDVLAGLCKAGYLVTSTGQSLAFAVLLVKNWRLYRIFYKTALKKKVPPYLSDRYLLFAVVLLVIPNILIQISWALINPLYYEETTYTLSPTTSLTVTHCSSDNLIAWEFISVAYFSALALILLIVSIQNSRVSTHFSEEGNQSSLAVIITMAVFAPSVMVLAFLSTNPRLYLYKFYLSAILSITLPDLLLATLFLKRFVVIWRERQEQTSLNRERRVSVQKHDQLVHLGEKASKLKLELMEKEQRLTSLKQRQVVKNRSDSAASAMSSTALLQSPTKTNESETDANTEYATFNSELFFSEIA